MTANIAREYLDALERLIDNKPRNPKLRRKAKLGLLKINISTVALEAGRSRTAIGTEGTKYPDVRARILAHMQPIVEINTSADVIRTLRIKNADLQRENNKLWTENANLIREIAVKATAMQRMKKISERYKKKLEKPDNTVVKLFD
jgi:hypothetical protein